jgi:mRNA interferase RelE/StbE
MYSVKLTKRAHKIFEKLAQSQPKMAARLAKGIDLLASQPDLGIQLKGELRGLWKYRVGSYRIIYQIVKRKLIVTIIDLGHRKDIYR